jgi:hypothetical protein
VTPDSIDDLVLDRVLTSGLAALAPELEPVDVVLAGLRPRFQRARMRRRVVQASAALMALLVIGALAITQAPSLRRAHVTVESPSHHSQASGTPKAATHPRRSASAGTQATQPAPTNASPGSSSASHIVVAPSSGAASSQAPASSGPSATQSSQSPATAAPSPAVRYLSWGGSIVVRLSGGRLTLVQVSPYKGNRAEVRTRRATHIDVVFTRKDRAISRIEVVVANGQMRRVPHVTADESVMRFGSTRHMSAASGTARHQVAFAAVRALPSARRLAKASASTNHTRHEHNKNRHAGDQSI